MNLKRLLHFDALTVLSGSFFTALFVNLLAGLFASLFFGLFASVATADTKAEVLPLNRQIMVSLYRGPFGTGSDQDARDVYNAMDVPSQGSIIGIGKGIVDHDKIFNLTCADRGQSGFYCSILIRAGAETEIRTGPIYAVYDVTGEKAQALARQFVGGALEFTSQEGTLHLSVHPERVRVVYQE